MAKMDRINRDRATVRLDSAGQTVPEHMADALGQPPPVLHHPLGCLVDRCGVNRFGDLTDDGTPNDSFKT